jgi:tRNA pseudouridine38-40 synthase
MYRKKCLCEYDGTAYSGWQFQEGLVTIQDTIEKALSPLYGGEKITIMGSGRTDSGVHAMGQVFHYTTNIWRENRSVTNSLNSVLPRDIAIISTEDVPLDFHAQMSAISKTYKYVILNRDARAGLDNNRVWFRRSPIDVDLLRKLLEPLVGTHDFTTFCVRKSIKQNSVRTINFINVEKSGDYVIVRLNANGFLHNMIRIIMGTAVNMTFEGGTPEQMVKILAARDRLAALATAPPHGLYLEEVFYM